MADMIEAGQLTEAEARVHPNRSVITRAIGSDPHMQPDIYELNVETGDRILLCSDGICTMIEDPQIEHVMGHSRTAQECADNLVAAALEAGGFDNATAVVVDVEGFREVRERKAQRKSKILYTFLVLAVIAIFAIAGVTAYQYVNNSAYLVNQDGKVAVYRGLQDDLFGMPLSSLDRVTDVDVNKLSPSVASRINDGISVGSMDEANELIASYREDIARQDAATKQSDASASTDKAASSDSSASKTKKSANESE
jgi:protein phosphatase